MSSIEHGESLKRVRRSKLFQYGAVIVTIAALAAALGPCCVFCCCERTTEDSCHMASDDPCERVTESVQKAGPCSADPGSATLAIPSEALELIALFAPQVHVELFHDAAATGESYDGAPPDLLRPGGLKAGLNALHCVFLT